MTAERGRAVFVDEADIEVKAGDGGDGVVSFRREKFVPRGGPDGGDGGHGGDVILLADPHLRTLIDLRYRPRYHAEDGGRGGANRRRGKNGKQVVIHLPLGTLVREVDGNRAVADLTEPGEQVALLRGGRGGRGNVRFASATRRTPRFAEKGEPGQARRLSLELKLLADVGVIGFPNAGKSSLISRVSAARPKVAAYPFTTLQPNLGVVRLEGGNSFVIADLPGLVEGAHRGVGRGHAFLRHVERTRLLIHLLDAACERDPREDFVVLNRELALYDAELGQRPQLVALNKLDLNPPPDRLAEVEGFLEEQGHTVFRISALTGEGVVRLMGHASQSLGELPAPVTKSTTTVLAPAQEAEEPLQVRRIQQGIYQVSGEKVERTVIMTDLTNDDGLRYLHSRLERMGVIRRLRELGAKDGDRVRVGAVELEFVQ